MPPQPLSSADGAEMSRRGSKQDEDGRQNRYTRMRWPYGTAGKRAGHPFGYAGTEDWNNIKTDLNMKRTLWESYTQKLVRAPPACAAAAP